LARDIGLIINYLQRLPNSIPACFRHIYGTVNLALAQMARSANASGQRRRSVYVAIDPSLPVAVRKRGRSSRHVAGHQSPPAHARRTRSRSLELLVRVKWAVAGEYRLRSSDAHRPGVSERLRGVEAPALPAAVPRALSVWRSPRARDSAPSGHHSAR
jgi:hypothetical protein